MEIGFTIASGSGSGEIYGVIPKLRALELSSDTFYLDDPAGAAISAFENKLPRSALQISPADSRLAIDGAGNLVVGSSPSALGSINFTVVETLPEAANSPRRTALTVTVIPPVVSSLDFSTPRNSQYIGQVI